MPTQLYALLICLLIAAGSRATRRCVAPAGTRYLLGVGAVLLAWGGLCQWRDPASQTLGAAPLVLGGVRLLLIQWGVLGAGLLHMGAAGWLRWRGAAAGTPAGRGQVRPGRQLAGVAGLLALTAVLAPYALTGAEFRVLQGALGVVLLAELAARLPALGTLGTLGTGRWQPHLGLAAALSLLVLMSQAPAPTARPDSARALEFSVGGVQGGFDQDVFYPESGGGGGCGGGGGGPLVPPSRDGYQHRYRAVGGQVAYQFRSRDTGALNTVGLGVWRGTDEITYAPQSLQGPLTFSGSATQTTTTLLSINPFVEGQYPAYFDMRGFALGYHAGLHLGTLTQTSVERGSSGPKTSTSLAPDLLVWAGNRQRLFAQADMGYGLSGLGLYTYRLGLGSGLGSRRGGFLTAGYAFGDYDPFRGLMEKEGSQRLAEQTPGTNMGFVAASINLGNSGFRLEPTFATDFDRTTQASFKLHYRLGLK